MSRKKTTQADSMRTIAAASMIVIAGLGAGKLMFDTNSPRVLGSSTLLAKNGSDDSSSNSGSNSGSDSGSSGKEAEHAAEPVEVHVNTESSTQSQPTSAPAESKPAETPKSAETSGSSGSKSGSSSTNSNGSGPSAKSGSSKLIIRKPVVSPTVKAVELKTPEVETHNSLESPKPEVEHSIVEPTQSLVKHSEIETEIKTEAEHVNVASAGAERFLFKRGNSGAVTSFPVILDTETNKVTVTTPTGQRSITVLPQEAIDNVMSSKLLSRVGNASGETASESADLKSVPQLITLTEKNGVPVYEISGASDQKLFGLFPVQVKKNLTVSAETGDVMSVDSTLASKILDFISF